MFGYEDREETLGRSKWRIGWMVEKQEAVGFESGVSRL